MFDAEIIVQDALYVIRTFGGGSLCYRNIIRHFQLYTSGLLLITIGHDNIKCIYAVEKYHIINQHRSKIPTQLPMHKENDFSFLENCELFGARPIV